MLKVINNFCEENTLKQLFRFAADNAHKNIWSNSLKWDTSIIKDSNTVHILALDNQSYKARAGYMKIDPAFPLSGTLTYVLT